MHEVCILFASKNSAGRGPCNTILSYSAMEFGLVVFIYSLVQRDSKSFQLINKYWKSIAQVTSE